MLRHSYNEVMAVVLKENVPIEVNAPDDLLSN